MGQQPTSVTAVRPNRGPVNRTRWWGSLAIAVALAFAMLVPAGSQAEGSSPGGPVILMGLDSELTPGQASHGPPEDHQAMVGALLAAVNNGGEGLLVIGDGSNIRSYWKDDVADPLGVPVTFVSGAENIQNADFAGYAMIGVASSTHQLSGSNGLTNAESLALNSRDIDIAEFVNSGGGLLGKTQDGLPDPFGYVGPLGTFVPTSASFSSVEVTQAGLDLGLTQSGMDGWCCYHEVFDSFPDFMEVLITHDAGGIHQGKAAAVGGVNVQIPTGIELEPSSAALEVGGTHVLTAIVEEDDAPVEDREVAFTVIDGPHAGTTGTADTDEDGRATFAYEGTSAGVDTIRASFVDRLARNRSSNDVTVEWIPVPDSLSLAPSTANGLVGDQHTVTASLTDSEGDPLADAEVSFTVTDGPHAGTSATADTDADGKATFTYEGQAIGTDTIVATHAPERGDELTSNEVTIQWAEVLGEVEEADDEDDEDDEDDAIEEIQEAEPAEAVEDDPDFTG
jgi:hypothetical protein